MDQLLAQLDSRDETVKQESANVLNDMQLNQQAEQVEPTSKQDPKSRFRARQVWLTGGIQIKAHSPRPERPRAWFRATSTTLPKRPGFSKKRKTKRETLKMFATS
jgi:hypothetical protein